MWLPSFLYCVQTGAFVLFLLFVQDRVSRCSPRLVSNSNILLPLPGLGGIQGVSRHAWTNWCFKMTNDVVNGQNCMKCGARLVHTEGSKRTTAITGPERQTKGGKHEELTPHNFRGL